MLRKCSLALAILLTTHALLAADLGKYKDWHTQPLAYFMTNADRAEWARLQNEAEAGQFVQKYIEARGGDPFVTEVTKRTQMADKYLTIGDLPGSKTTRGKIVILLGPPASMDVSVKPNKSTRRGSVGMSVSAGANPDAMGPSVGDMADASIRGSMSGEGTLHNYTLSYLAEKLPVKESLTVVVEVNSATGKDRVPDKKDTAKLALVLEAAAQASVRPPAN